MLRIHAVLLVGVFSVFTCVCAGGEEAIAKKRGLVPTWEVNHELACKAPSGPLDDASCDVEAVEKANREQLWGILEELTNTTYFRLMQINLQGKCNFWGKGLDDCNKTLPETDEEGDSEDIEGGGKKKKKACDLDLSNSPTVAAKKPVPAFDTPPPGLFGGGLPMGGFTPMPGQANVVDRTITQEEKASIKAMDDEKCNDATLPEFWLDMCRNIPTNSSDYVNLMLNPERWTGYNGSHVWNAIYHENCFEKMGDLEEMCYEERVLYRLLSGMHASINIHISLNYFPPSKGKREKWEPNLERFMQQFGTQPERLKNLHFAFVVLLRAFAKASPYLYNYPFHAGDAGEDEKVAKLVQRLLDSDVMGSCASVFEAFDETLMFKEGDEPSTLTTLKSQFKGVFHNISQVMDCISCQKCKLHGKIQLLGMGTALKILLLPEQLIAASLTRPELVALFNTLHKFSNAIQKVPELSAMYQAVQMSYKSSILEEATPRIAETPTSTPPPMSGGFASSGKAAPAYSQEHAGDLDAGVAAVAGAARSGSVGDGDEDALIDGLLDRDGDLLLLARHYAARSPARFVQHAVRYVRSSGSARPNSAASMMGQGEPVWDAIIIGGGLAGLSAALTMLDRGGRVVLLEKQGHLGGNSAWASSGVNAVDVNNTASGDSVDAFTADTVKGAGRGDNPLIPVLTSGSVDALAWLRGRLSEHLSLDLVGQMGGHSFPRTHRPSSGLAGSAMIFAIQKQLEKVLKDGSGRFELMKWTRASKLITEGGAVVGVEYDVYTAKEQTKPQSSGKLMGRNVLIATGGYASDYTEDSLLKEHRPDLLKYATTNNKGTTGDGHKLALAVGAKGLGLDDVQVHPTGFFNPRDPDNKVKTLCAEILRGEGGVLLDSKGHRFANELGTRDYVTGRMIQQEPQTLKFALVMNEATARKAETHIGLYTKKGLITKFETLEELAKWDYWGMFVTEKSLQQALKKYDEDAEKGIDSFGKKFFHNVPYNTNGPFYVGIVTPVIHYCMGGIAIDPEGQVLDKDMQPIPGLHAAGEVIGGLHGQNRLGGNALSECVVFGRKIGLSLPVGGGSEAGTPSISEPAVEAKGGESAGGGPRKVTWEEMKKHTTEESCWVVINDKVYDFTNFLDEHPAGAEAILRFGGQDGTEIFEAIHTPEMLEDFTPIGDLAS